MLMNIEKRILMDIREEAGKGLVFINGLAICAFIDEGLCQKCHKNKIYSYEFDAYFCIHCDEWLEKPCQDPDCRHCPKRPAKPSTLLETPEDPDDPIFMHKEKQPGTECGQLELDVIVTSSEPDKDLEIS